MPRWEPEARARLEAAALELYSERGFDSTTVEQIAERAGLTKRTFFRHFADKREVLFGSGDVASAVAASVRAAPPDAGPLDATMNGIITLAADLDRQGEQAARRIAIARATPDLWERQLVKFALLTEAIASALRERGVPDRIAVLAAETGITALRVAADEWIANRRDRSLRILVAECVADIREMSGSSDRK